MSTLPPLDQVDRTKAFTDEQYEELKTLPSELRLKYMARPNSKMSQADVERHYKSSNYPEVKYGPSGSLTPPHMRGLKS